MTLRPGVHTVPTADRDGITALLRAMTDSFEGLGPVLPLGPGRKQPAVFDGWPPFGPRGWLAALPPNAGALIATSGSTGEPKLVVLSADALRASGEATHARLSGPGRWLLALPAHHIAGFQVVARSALAGTTPVAVDSGSFSAASFTAAAKKVVGGDLPAYVSLVPTQLARLIADDAARDLLSGFTAVLLGGAAAGPHLLQQSREQGINVVTTYGMSETAGGCVYDGHALDGASWRLADDGRIWLGGATIASGYLGRPDLTAAAFIEVEGTRWFRTEDLGTIVNNRLEIIGRSDDVIISGGANIAPAPIEALLQSHDAVTEAVVVGVPDPHWGQAVVALIVGSASQEELHELARARLDKYAVPKQYFHQDALPTLESGKIDRKAALAVASGLYRSEPQ